MHCLVGASCGSPSQNMNLLHRSLVMWSFKYSPTVLHGISNAIIWNFQSLQQQRLRLVFWFPQGTKTSGVGAEAEEYPIPIQRAIASMPHYLRFIRNCHHILASLLNTRIESQFAQAQDCPTEKRGRQSPNSFTSRNEVGHLLMVRAA